MVLNNFPRWSNADHYNYLATIDEFVSRLCPKQRDSVWHKLNGSDSQFLDTIVESAWALYFWDNGISVDLEKKFDPSRPELGDADFYIFHEGLSYWLDATSVAFCRRPNSREELIATLAKRAKDKYRVKFTSAATSAHLKCSSVGVLLCVLRREPSVFPLLVSDLCENVQFPAPPTLFDDQRPSLTLVCVHTLSSDRRSDVLRPSPIITWMPNKSNSEAAVSSGATLAS